MRNALWIIGILVFTVPALAQGDPLVDYNRNVIGKWKGDYVRVGPYRVKGSPYLFGDSFDGSIVYNESQTVIATKVLYNLFEQKAGMEVKDGMFETEEAIERFSIVLPEKFGSKMLVFKNALLYNSTEKGFFNILEDGKKVVFLKMFKTQLIPDLSNPLAKDNKVFEQYQEYYFFVKDSKILTKIKLRKQDLLKALKGNHKIEQMIKESVLDFSKESNFALLVSKYNNSQ